MNYSPRLLKSLFLMLIFSHFGFSMKGQPPRKSAGLNPYAQEFHPQRQLIRNSSLSGPPTSRFISNTIQSHHHSADDPIKLPDFLFDFEENEKPITLPDSLFPWEEKEQTLSSQNDHITPPEMGSNSQSIHIIPTEIEKANGSQGTDAFNPILKKGENPSETWQNKVDSVHQQEVDPHQKQEKTADFQLADKKQIDELSKSVDHTHNTSSFLSKSMTPIESKSNSFSKSGKEKQQHSQQQQQRSNHRDKYNRQYGSGSNLPPKGEESRFNPIHNPHEQILENDEDNVEHKDQIKISGNQQQQSRKSSKSKGKGKDKQKVVLTKEEINIKKIKEKEDNEYLEKEAENRRKEMEKLKLEEDQQKMNNKKEDGQQKRKQKLDNVFSSSNIALKKEVAGKQLYHPALSATPPIDPTINNVHMHGEASTSSGSGSRGRGGDEINEAANSTSDSAATVESESLLLIKREIERKEKLEKFNKIEKFLTKLHKKLDEIEKLEHLWLIERIQQFNIEDINLDPNEKKEGEIHQIKIEIYKLTDEYESIKKEKKNILELTEKKKELTSMKENNLIKLKSINRKKKKINDKHKPAIENFNKIIEELDHTEYLLWEKQKYEKNLQKQIDELQKSLIYKFIKLKNNLEPVTEKIKEIQKQMEEPLKHLWIGYDIILKILDQHWKTPEIKEKYYDRQPFDYNLISDVFAIAKITNENDSDYKAELSAFESTMQLILEKMLLHQNIYRIMNFKVTINGESISVYERLNCFDELSEKMKILAEKRKEIELSKNQDEHITIQAKSLIIFGKFFKEELNQKIREVLSFIMVGLDLLPDVWDQMVLNGIKELSIWLPKNQIRQMDEIWMDLFNYYYWEENSNVQFLSKSVNDKEAENVFDLSPDDEYFEELRKQLSIIDELHQRVNSLIDTDENEMKEFMSDAFGHIKAWIQSIKMVVKIEKRENHVKPLPYLKSVYEKYWYWIYKDRFIYYFKYVQQYEFEINQINRTKIKNELLARTLMEKNKIKVKPIFQQISLIDSDILIKMMKVFDALNEFLMEFKIFDRFKKYTNDPDFMDSICKNNPNIDHYNSLLEELYKNHDE